MKTLLKPLAFLFLVIFTLSCSSDNTIKLFNGEDLENWNVFVSSPDVEPGDLFWVKDGVIHTSGIPNGYIRTKETYSNSDDDCRYRQSIEERGQKRRRE